MPARAQGVVTVYMYVSKTVTGFAKALALLTYGATRLNDGQNGAATASRQRRIALAVMNYFRRESRVDRGDHARFEEVRVDEGGWTSIVVVHTGNDPERLITFWISGGDWRPLFNVLTD